MEPLNTGNGNSASQVPQYHVEAEKFEEIQHKMAEIAHLGEVCTRLISSSNNLVSRTNEHPPEIKDLQQLAHRISKQESGIVMEGDLHVTQKAVDEGIVPGGKVSLFHKYDHENKYERVQSMMAKISHIGNVCTGLISSANTNNFSSLQERTVTNLPSGRQQTGIPGQPESWRKK